MDNKFAKDAFEKAEAQRLNAEAEAWAGVAKAALASAVGVAIFHAGMDMVKVIEFVNKSGLANALHEYEYALMMGGFSLGYKAGQESMLEK